MNIVPKNHFLTNILHIAIEFFTFLKEKRFKKAKRIYISVILALCLFLQIIFFLVYTATYSSQSIRLNLHSMETNLDSVISNIDYLLRICIYEPAARLEDNKIISSVSFHGSYKLNTNVANQCENTLHSFVNSTPLISSAFLYVLASEQVITSYLSSGSLSDFEYEQMVNAYMRQSVSACTLNNEDVNFSMFLFNGQLYAAKDLYVLPDSKQSTLFVQINTDELSQTISNSLTEGNACYLYNAARDSLLPDNETLSFSQLEPYSDASSTDAKKFGDSYIIEKVSSYTGWQYFLLIDSSNVLPAYSWIFLQILPYCIILFMLSCSLSFFVAFYLSQPYFIVMNKLPTPEAPGESDGRTTFERLNDSLSTIITRQTEMNHMMKSLSRDVLSQLFRQLIGGITITSQEMQNILDNTDSPFFLNGLSVAIAMENQDPSPVSVRQSYETEMQLAAYLQSLALLNHVHSYVLSLADGDFAVFVQFDNPDQTLLEGKHTLHLLMDGLDTFAREYSLSYRLGHGHLYHTLLDVGFSYSEARKMLKKETAQPDSLLSFSPEEETARHYEYQARQIIEEITNMKPETACHIAENTIREIYQPEISLQEQKTSIKILIHTLTDLIATFPYINYDKIPNDYNQFDTQQEAFEDTESRAAHAQAFLKEILDAFSSQIKAQKNPHITAARKYIQEHYREPDLSLENIAAYVGISGNYLSRLFSEKLNVKLFDYINHTRIEQSMDSLMNTSLPISRIAEMFGFIDSRNYIRVFKKYYGSSPGVYREQHSNQQGGKKKK